MEHLWDFPSHFGAHFSGHTYIRQSPIKGTIPNSEHTQIQHIILGYLHQHASIEKDIRRITVQEMMGEP